MKTKRQSSTLTAADRQQVRKGVRAYLVRLAGVVGPWEACTLLLIEATNLLAQLESPPAAALRLTAVAEALVDEFEAAPSSSVQ